MVAVAMTLVAVCPCQPPAASDADPHACCREAAAAAISADPGSCCDDEGIVVPAVASPTAASAAAPDAAHIVEPSSFAAAVRVDLAPAPPPRAFRVLRI
jgi:hypothetical protein